MVGRMATLAPLRSGRSWRRSNYDLMGKMAEDEGEEDGPGLPRDCTFPLSFVNICFVTFLLAEQGRRKQGSPTCRQGAVKLHARALDGDRIYIGGEL